MAEQIPESPYVVVIGAAGIDSKGRAARPLANHTSTPGTVRVTVGGVARNVADNLARLGIEAILLSAIGNDGSGRRICNNAVEAGINIDYLITSPNHHTAAYLVILDETGNQVMSVDDMGIMECITPSQINQRRELIQNADMIVLDSNLSQQTIATIFKIANRYKIPVCADPTSASLTRKLIPHLTAISMITPNVTEAETLTGLSITNEDEALIAARKLVNMGVKIAIITLAEMGVVYATANASGHIPAVSTQLIDATGASDALTATVVFGLLNDIPLDEAVRLGAGAAALTLDCTDTVRQDLSLDLLYDQLLI